MERMDVEIDAAAHDVLAEQAGRVSFLERRLETRYGLAEKLAAHVVVSHRRVGGVGADRQSLDQRMRVVAQDVAIVAGARLALVRVAHEVLLDRRVARHEAPLRAGGKRRAAAAAQAGGLHARR